MIRKFSKSLDGKYIIKYRWWIITFFVVVTIGFGIQIPKSEIDPDLANYLPETMTSRINTDSLVSIFGGNGTLMIVLETDDVLNSGTLERLQLLSESLDNLNGVKRNLSLFNSKSIVGDEGMLIVNPAIDEIPTTSEEREILRENLKNNKMAFKNVVSADFRFSSIILLLDKDVNDKEFLTEVEGVIEQFPGPEKVYIGGLPVIRATITSQMSHDFMLLMPVGLVIMLIMLYAFFQQKRGMLLPFFAVVMSIIISMGLLPLLGWKLSMISILLPVILIAVANDYGIHMVAHYQELARIEGKKANPIKLAVRVYQNLKRPIILTGLTTIAGILSLLTHKMVPAKQLGILAAIGIAIALTMSLFLIPAILSIFKKTQTPESFFGMKKDYLGMVLSSIGKFVSIHPKRILYTSLILTFAAGTGIYFLKVDTNLVHFFPKNHPIRQGANVINENFGGTQTLSILVHGDIKDPDLLKRVDAYAKELRNFKGIGRVASISDVVKEMSKALNDKGDPWYNSIPDSRDAVAQYFGLYNFSGDEGDFDQLVDFDFQNAQVIITMNDASNSTIRSIIKKIDELTEGDPNIAFVGGHSYNTYELANLVITGQFRSIGLAIIIIFLLITIIFRSVSSGLISVIPLALAIIFLFGFMGILGFRLDISTALLSSIMIGVGVDYTIHFIWRYKVERRFIDDPRKAIQRTIETTGRGIFFNAMSVVIGFLVLFLSSFPPIRFFGFLVIISITACLAGAFLVIPGLLVTWKPRFVEPNRKKVR